MHIFHMRKWSILNMEISRLSYAYLFENNLCILLQRSYIIWQQVLLNPAEFKIFLDNTFIMYLNSFYQQFLSHLLFIQSCLEAYTVHIKQRLICNISHYFHWCLPKKALSPICQNILCAFILFFLNDFFVGKKYEWGKYKRALSGK